MFDEMVANIREETAKRMLRVMPVAEVNRLDISKSIVGEGLKQDRPPVQASARQNEVQNSVYGSAAKPQAAKTPVRVTKVGRNDPCPCGSGKKYKKCCGRNENDE